LWTIWIGKGMSAQLKSAQAGEAFGYGRSLPDSVSSALTAAQNRHTERNSRPLWESIAIERSACARALVILSLSQHSFESPRPKTFTRC